MDYNRLAHVSRISESFAKQVVSAHDWLLLASPEAPERELCESVGMAPEVYEAIAHADGELARPQGPDRF